MTKRLFQGREPPFRHGSAAAGEGARNFNLIRNAAFTSEGDEAGTQTEAVQQGAHRDPSPTVADEEGSADGGGSSPPRSGTPRQPRQPEPRTGPGTDDEQRWLENYRRNEVRWLSNRAEELERRLRRRTIVLGGALVLCSITAAAAVVGFAVVRLDGPEAPDARTGAAATAGAAAVGERLKEVEAANAEHEATIARLRAELESSRAEPESLRERLDSSQQEIERLNAIIASAKRLNAIIASAMGQAEPDAPAEVKGTGSSAASGTAGRVAEPGRSPTQQAPAMVQPTGAEGLEGEGRAEAAGDGGSARGLARASSEQPARPPRETARRDGRPVAASQDRDVRSREGDAAQGGPGATTGREAGPEVETLRAALARTKARIEGSEPPDDAPVAAGTVELRAGAPNSGTETRTLGERPDAGRRTMETAERTAVEGERGAVVGDAATGSDPEPATALAEAATGTSAGRGGDETRAGGAEHYAAISPVNLRAEPSDEAEVLAVVEEGDAVRRIGRRGGWLRVEYTSRIGADYAGWVRGRSLRRVEVSPRQGGPSARDGG